MRAARQSSLTSVPLLGETPGGSPSNIHACMHACVHAQAGTYIKEFVHGDGGRTQPCLGSLLGCSEPARILELDVLEVHMEFLP